LPDQSLDTFDHLERQSRMEQQFPHQNEKRDRGQREVHHRHHAVAHDLQQPRLAAQEHHGANDIDGNKR